MSGTALDAVQSAFYSRLTGDVTLMAMVTGVFDSSGQKFPYIDIGDGDETPFRVFGSATGSTSGHRTFKTVRIWTQDDKNKKGFKEGQTIYSRINVLLDGHALAVSGHSTVSCKLDEVFQDVEPDGVTRVVAATYEVITQ